jgi:hypothetical protein
MSEPVRRGRGGPALHAPDPFPDPKTPGVPPPPGPDVVPPAPVDEPEQVVPPAPVREPRSPAPPAIAHRLRGRPQGPRTARTLH